VVGTVGLFWVVLWLATFNTSGRAPLDATTDSSPNSEPDIADLKLAQQNAHPSKETTAKSEGSEWRRQSALPGSSTKTVLPSVLAGLTHPISPTAVAPSGDVARSFRTSPRIFRSQAFLGLLVASIFLNPCLYFYVNWLPTYLVASGQQFGQQLAARLFVIYLALDVGYLSGGILSFQLSRFLSLAKARLVVTSAGALLMMGIPAISKVQQPYWVTALICLATLGVGWFMVNYLSLSQEISLTRVSTVTGILGSAGAFSGGVFVWLVGVLSKGAGNFVLPILLLGVMPLLAFSGIWLNHRSNPSPVH